MVNVTYIALVYVYSNKEKSRNITLILHSQQQSPTKFLILNNRKQPKRNNYKMLSDWRFLYLLGNNYLCRCLIHGGPTERSNISKSTQFYEKKTRLIFFLNQSINTKLNPPPPPPGGGARSNFNISNENPNFFYRFGFYSTKYESFLKIFFSISSRWRYHR